MTRLDDLTNNSTLGTNGRYLVGSKKKEDALKASKQVWEGGLIIVVSYAGTNYIKLTDGKNTFAQLASEGGAPTVTSDEISDATTVGKALLTASDAAAARTGIGAPSVSDVTAKVAKAGDTMTGQLIIADTVNQTKAILCKHPTAGASDAPTAFDLTSSYLHLGGTEYGTNSYRLLTFGYRRNLDKSHAPAVIGYQETSASSEDKGRLIFATRDVITDTAPTVRLHIETNGDIAAQTGARFVGNGNGLTGVVGTVANTLTTGRTFSLTGGATGTSAAFNGSANASIAVTLATPTGAVRGGVLQATAQADSVATTVPELVADFNALLAKLRTAGILAT